MNEKEIMAKVDERVRKELEGKIDPRQFGYIHIFEQRKKEILEEEYEIKFITSREKDKDRSID